MSPELFIADLLRVAQEDLDAARLLKVAGNRNAMVHCALAAEKVIHVVLLSEGFHPGTEHPLQKLVSVVPDENPVKPLLRVIEYLWHYATAYRYPLENGEIAPSPPPALIDDALDKVERALHETAARFEVDLDRRGTPSKRLAPIR